MSAQAETKITRECKGVVVNSDDEQGIVEMIVSVFGVEDYGSDVMEKGCFKDSLKRKLPKGVWMHDGTQPVAKTLEAKELGPNDALLSDETKSYGGLYIKGQFNLKTQRGREAYEDIKFGAIDEFSIGFFADRETTRVVKNVRYIKKAHLIEWSPVLMGMNPLTQVVSVKEAAAMETKSQYLGEFVENRATLSACETVTNALFWAMYLCLYDETKTLEEKLAFVEGAANEAAVLIVEITRSVLSIAQPEEVTKAATELKALAVDPSLLNVTPRTGLTLKSQIDVAHTANQSLVSRFQDIAEWKALDRATARTVVLSEANRQSLTERIAEMKSVLASAEKLLSDTAPIDTNQPDPSAMQAQIKMLARLVEKYA